ncbi:MAG: hypothetical protein A3K19_06820 [Lentisphaerae bacterium RIFOXYB12_FULL_65_16]|nr:MAG: hypothetical protein A3K18_21950 [Lentisphaerae bacterium RIFOXYA12_64_32]OGV93162.1 MAG: hypothetical protein A3K19_06820 [Lentisphaerae bacterium RIFOXYB12_FULL_65_16]
MSIERIFILHHTHVDLGYTGDRDAVCGDLVRMVDLSIDAVAATQDEPDAERFRWVHEVSWPVLEYLKRPEARRNELFAQLRRGDTELTALYVHPTDLFDRDSFEVSIDRACQLAHDQHLPLNTAMFSDCPGIPWCVPDILAARGVRYLSAAPDFIMSMPLDLERPFWWEGPNGGRVLTWFTEWRKSWYAEGLVLGLAGDPVAATANVLDYIRQLEAEGYRWKCLALHLAMDNQPPRPNLLEFVRHFNAVQPERQVQLATNRMFFEYMEEQHGAEFSVHRGAWPDWWANGNASAAWESACSRQAKCILRRTAGVAARLGRTRDAALVDQAIENGLLFDEHTWGHNRSVSHPWSLEARLHWAKKRILAGNALHAARATEERLLAGLADRGQLVLVNSTDVPYSGPVALPTAATATPMMWRDEAGQTLVTQSSTTTGETLAWVELPASAVCRFRATEGAPPEPTGLENAFFRLAWDAATGAVRDWVDLRLGQSLLDGNAEWTFADIIHERVRRGGRKDMYDTAFGCANPDAKRPRPEFVRTAGHRGKTRPKLVCGPVFSALVTRGKVPGARFVRELRIYHGAPRLDIILRLDKQVNTEYESLYVAFPFAALPPAVFIENAGAVYRAGEEQLPGSATDWHSVGDYVAVGGGGHTVLVVPHDAPLVQVGDIHTGKWQRRLQFERNHVFSWVMNNMWFTNFPAYQEGEVTLTWSLTASAGAFSPAAAAAFAQAARTGVAVSFGGMP